MGTTADAHPFLFVGHGTPDVDSIGKCEEVFLWFRGPVAEADRARVMAGVPSPLHDVLHWDREFCYFGSAGDSYDWSVVMDYTPEPERSALRAADPTGDAKAWHRAYHAASDRLAEAAAAFAEDLDRWLLGVHAVAPIAAFWGVSGAPEDDPWHRWSVARFPDAMADRLARHEPDRGGAEYLRWIKSRCAPLFVAPAKKRRAADDDARAVATLNDACREGRPMEHVPRLSYAEGEVLRHGELVAGFVGKGDDWAERLERLAPLTQLTFLASYDVDHARLARVYPSLPERLRVLVEGLAPDERRAALPLLVMTAQTITRDTPAFDRPRRRHGELAAHVLRVGYDQPGCRGATYARTSRYLRWAKRHAEARATAEEGMFRYGERRTLLRAAWKAARAMGDDEAARRYEARLTALAGEAT